MNRGIGVDILGNIVLIKFPKGTKVKQKKQFAKKFLKKNKSIKTALEKTREFRGRLRKQESKHILGEKTKEVLYKENNCFFRFNVDSTYFSPRLSNERKEIASLIKKNNEVLVMFAGVSPFSIVIAKLSKAKNIVSVEVNRQASKYAKLNVQLNKVKDKVEIIQGDIKRIAERLLKGKLSEEKEIKDFQVSPGKNRRLSRKFDVIVMPRPKLKDTFLKEAFSLSKKGTRIYYYDFCGIYEKNLILEKIKNEAKKSRKKIKILKTKVAGEIAPYKIRLGFFVF